MTAFYDFFRYIKLYSTDGTTLEATLEGDSVTDSLNISRGNGVAFTGANASTDSFKIDVDYDLTVPVSTTSIRLSDVNSNNKDIALVAGGNMTIVRDSANQLTISALIGGVSKSISAITQANPARVTTTNPHNYTEGTPVTIVDVVGMTNVNGNEYFMNVIDGNNFDLYTDDLLSTGLNSTGFPAYVSGGVATADYGGAKQAFKTIRVSGQTDVVADTIADLLTLVGGTGIDITTTAGTDTISYAIDSTVATLAGSQTLTNKTINGPDNTLTNIANSSLSNSSITFARVGGNSTAASLGDTVSFQGTASEVTVGESSGTFTIGLPASVAITTGLTVNGITAVTESATQTLTNKSIDLTDNTLTGTLAELSTAISDDTVVGLNATQTLNNKTLFLPTLDVAVYTTGFGGTGDMDITGNATFKSTEAHAFADPRIYLSRQSPSPAANDVIGGLVLRGYDSGGSSNGDKEYASVYGKILDTSSTARDGRIEFHVATSNTVEHSASFENEYFNLMTEQKIRWHNHKGTTYECDLDWTTPTANRTISFPNGSGTVVVTASSPLSTSAAGDISLGTVPVAKGGTNSTTASAARTALGVQELNSNLTAISGLTSAADKGIYFTGSGTAGVYDLPSQARTLLAASAVSGAGSQRKLLTLDTDDDVQFDSFGVGTAASGTTGEIRATNNITGYYSSDSRLKENIQNIPDALDKIMMLKGVTFDWTDEHIKERGGEDGYFVKKHDTGLIAQDVQQVLPEIVRKKKDGYLGIQYDKTVGLLVEAIKELKAEIEQLKSKG
tara:strand:- start:3480 stop:5843 length:2364 start_codon:yes stop_codon:yes gene_type:complete